jgi:hypothetical protein
MKRGGSAPLLLSPGLGSSNGGLDASLPTTAGSGVSKASEKKDQLEKIPLSNVISKLEKLHIADGKPRKNVRFMV